MKNQKSHWNSLHQKQFLQPFSNNETTFAREVINYFPKKAKILELGCGAGNDSGFFGKQGFEIIATDFSETTIGQNKKTYSQFPSLSFQNFDISQPFPFNSKAFDVIYARLSLHYFTDKKTKAIFNELYRVLKPNGLLCFICKSHQDPLYGNGVMLEKDMYENEGHIRHFFSENYAKKLLANKYEIKILSSEKESLYGHNSAFIQVIASKL